MTVEELIDQLRQMPQNAPVSFQVEDQISSPRQVVWDGANAVLWDGDRLYPVPLAEEDDK